MSTELSVMSLMDKMVSSGNATAETIEKMLDIQMRIMHKQSEINFNTAFSEMSREMPLIKKNKRSHTATYATLEEIIHVTRPILSKFGFSISFENEQGADRSITVKCVLMHKEGFSRKTSITLPCVEVNKGMNPMQAIGAAITYGKRYTITEILNIGTYEDDNNGYSKKTLSNERFAKALEKIQSGSYTREALLASHTLTDEQLAQL